MSSKLFIYDQHHHVLDAWNMYPGSNILTLDYHTDTHVAFLQYSYNKYRKQGYYPDECVRLATVEQESIINQYKNGTYSLGDCIKLLKHDEHIDFAVRVGISSNVFIIPSGSGGNNGLVNKKIFDARHQREYSGEPIIEYNYTCLPNCTRCPHDDNCVVDLAENIIDDNFLNYASNYIMEYVPLFFNNYILDIDLDYFRTIKAFNTHGLSILKQLAHNARIITIAREDVCLEMNRLEGDPLNADYALSSLKKILNL